MKYSFLNLVSYLQAISIFDLYGVPVSLYINKKSKLKSKFGAFISLTVLVIITYIIVTNIESWFKFKNFKIISSAINYSATELVINKKTFDYNFTSSSFYNFFGPYFFFPNGTQIGHGALNRFFLFKYEYIDKLYNIKDVKVSNCSSYLMDKFTGMDETLTENDKYKYSQLAVCSNESINMGLYADPVKRALNRTSLRYTIYPCQNSTENNNNCASFDEITSLIPYLWLQIGVPRTFFDFKNLEKSKKTSYDYQYYRMDPKLGKTFLNNLLPVSLVSDRGTFYEDYVVDSVDFNSDTLNMENFLRNQNDYLFQYTYIISMNTQTYYKQNLRLNELAGTIGGIISLVFGVGKIICLFYNNLYMKYLLINDTFTMESEGTTNK